MEQQNNERLPLKIGVLGAIEDNDRANGYQASIYLLCQPFSLTTVIELG